MARRIKVGAISLLLCLPFLSIQTPASGLAGYDVYDSFTGGSGNLNASSGGSDSTGFTGNWATVPGQKSGGATLSTTPIYGTDNNFAYPVRSRYTSPVSNTVAAASTLWKVYYAGRQLSNPISFDSNGITYLSFLTLAPSQGANWGAAVVGLLNGWPSSTSDATKMALYFGWSYSSTMVINYGQANKPVWESTPYSAQGPSSTSTAGGKSWFVLVKITRAASGSDQFQLKAFAPTDSLPTSDASITWDATYSNAITGSWPYLAVQTEFYAEVDDVRLSNSYEAAAGVPANLSVGTPSIAASANKGISTNITVTTDAPGKVRFFMDGKRIPGCINVVTTGSANSYSATCPWKPSAMGNRKVSASLIPQDSAYPTTSSSTQNVLVLKRTNSR